MHPPSFSLSGYWFRLSKSANSQVYPSAERPSRNQNSEYLAQRRKALSFRPKGEIFSRSLASARDDGPWPVTWRSWRLGASKSPGSRFTDIGNLQATKTFKHSGTDMSRNHQETGELTDVRHGLDAPDRFDDLIHIFLAQHGFHQPGGFFLHLFAGSWDSPDARDS